MVGLCLTGPHMVYDAAPLRLFTSGPNPPDHTPPLMLIDGIPFRLGPYRANGFSVSSRATFVMLPTFDLCLDLGWCIEPMRDISRVFISHLHQDHCAGLPAWLDWRQSQIETSGLPRIFLPEASAGPAARWLDAAAEAQHMAPLRYELAPMKDGDLLELGGHYILEAFESTHNVPAMGAIIHKRLTRLDPAYEGLSGAEIGAHIDAGEEVHHTELRPTIAYTGDTTEELFERRPELLRAEVLLVECSYVDGALVDGTRSRSRFGERPEVGHCHIRPLSRLLDAFEGEHLVLCHLPPHYAHCDLYGFFLPRLPPTQRSKLQLVPHRARHEPDAPTARPAPAPTLPLPQVPPALSPLSRCEEAYLRFLEEQPELLEWLLSSAADVALNRGDAPHGLTYRPSLDPATFADVALRRALVRLGRWFAGDHVMPLMGNRADGYALDPGVVPFDAPELITTPPPPLQSNIWPGSVAHFLGQFHDET